MTPEAFTRRALARATARDAVKVAHRERIADARSERRRANAREVEGRLLLAIERIERHPSVRNVERLRAMAADVTLHASIRAAAAKVVLRWAENPAPRKFRGKTPQ